MMAIQSVESKPKLFRLTTVPVSMNIIMKGQLAFMQQYFDVVGVTGYHEKHFNEILKREGVRMHPVEMKRNIALVRDVISLWQLYWLFKREKPQIVHTHTPKAGLLGMLAAFFARVPVRLHTVAGLPLLGVKGAKRTLLNSMERLTYLCANRVYPNSFGLQEIIIKNHFCKPDKMKVLGNGGSNGINIDFFKPEYAGDSVEHKKILRSNHHISDHDVVFCMVGRVAIEKGISELVDAFTQLQKEETDIRFKLVLIGTFEEQYGEISQELKLAITENPDILHLGRFDDVRPFYLMSDVYVFPSYREGFPNSVLEASAMSLPCIVTDINGCNEIITDGENGVIIPPRDRHALKAAMRRLAGNKDEARRMGEKAREATVQRYSREIIWNAMLNEYKSLLVNS